MLSRLLSKIICTLLLFAMNTVSGQTRYQQLFDSLGVSGSVTVYDLQSDRWYFTDTADARRPALPASTFKILNSLIALEYKAVANEFEVLRWDGQPKMHLGKVIEAWNHDADLRAAFRNSTIWFYVEIAKRIGRKRYKKILRKCKYGNGVLTEKGTDFWNYGDFAITPINQVEFLKKLYYNQLPFSATNMNKVKEIMISGTAGDFTARDKTGWTRKDGLDIGWHIGYWQSSGAVYFFATRLYKNEKDENPLFPTARKLVTVRVLTELINERSK